MAQLLEAEGDANPLVKLEGDYSSLTPTEKLALVHLASGRTKKYITTKLRLSQEKLNKLMLRDDSRQFVAELTHGAHLQMEALYVKSVDAVRETLEKGAYPDKIKAARLQMESTRRIGAMTAPSQGVVDVEARLVDLAHKLVDLNRQSKSGNTLTLTARRIDRETGTQDRENHLPATAQALRDGEGPVPEGNAPESDP